jgi:hypothetical protein
MPAARLVVDPTSVETGTMKVRRSFIYAGLFLVALGGVLVTADLNAVDTAALTDVIRIWPLVPIAIGLGIVLRRTPAALPAGMLAAAVPGLVLGGAVAAVPRFGGDCGARGTPSVVAEQQGTFDGAGSVSVSVGCGSLTVHTAAGSGWAVAAGNTASRAPSIATDARSLSIDDWPGHRYDVLAAGRDAWDLTLPTTSLDALDVTTFANRSHLDLAGAQIGQLTIKADASDVIVDASAAASLASLTAVLNVGQLAIHLPAAADLIGAFRIGGGGLQLCAPPDLGVRVTVRGLPREIHVGGLSQNGTDWQSANYASAAHRADLSITATFGTVEINPIGGCK